MQRVSRNQTSSFGVLSALSAPSQTPQRNVIKDHIRALKQKERENRERREAEERSMSTAPAPSNRYAHVKSRLFKSAYPKSSTAISDIQSESYSRENIAPSVNLVLGRHKNFGKVPAYLLEAKATIEERKKREAERQAPKVIVPDGHRILPEEERLETIDLLEKRKTDVENQISKLPLRLDTDSQKRRQQDLHKRLTDIEKAIKFLSKPNVMIKIDE